MSNFGVHLRTTIFYSLGFLVDALFIWLAARSLGGQSLATRRFRNMLLLVSTMLVAVLLSTYGYKVNLALRDIHIVVSSAFICFELTAAFWMCRFILADKLNTVFLVIQIGGFVIAALTLLGVLQLLFSAQLITVLAFGIITIRSSRIVEKTDA